MPTQARIDIELPEGVQEQWATSKTYPLYEVSDYGRVRRKNNARLVAQRISQQGYPVVTLSIRGKVMVRFTHVLSMDAFVGPKPDGYFVQHIDGNKLNNTLQNLRYAQAANFGGVQAPHLRGAEYLPPQAVWTVSERGAVRYSAETLEELHEILLRALASDNNEPPF